MPAPGCLHVIATPIGNLGDITLRALEGLKQADLILAEDTRHSRKLLAHYDIHVPLHSLHKDNEFQRIPDILLELGSGKQVALISDAGMPGISDPGYGLIQAVIQAGLKFEILPGPSALLMALLGSGLNNQQFIFCGFPETKSGARRKSFTHWKYSPETLIFYVSPHQLVSVLQEMLEVWGDRPAALCRELTKMHEEYVRGPLSQLLLAAREKSLGEYTVVVEGSKDSAPLTQESLEEQLARLQQEGFSLNQAIARIARERHLPRQEVYTLAHSFQQKEN